MSDESIELPEGWEWGKLSDLAEKVGSGSTPRGGSESYKLSGVPLIRSMNVHFDGLKLDGLAYLDDKQADELKNVKVKVNDVLLNITGASIGRVTQAPFDMEGARVNQHVCIIRTHPALEPDFLSKYLASPSVQSLIMSEEYGATRQALTKQMILNFAIPLPPLNEQRRIVEAIDQLRDRSQKTRSALSAIPALCDQFRQSVLAAAFRGDLTADWREQNPDVEPASVLLERIKRDRQQKLVKSRTSVEEINLSELLCIPQTWAWERLVNISNLTGGVAKGRKFNGQPTIRSPYLRVANVQDGFLNLEEIKEIEVLPEDIHKYRLESGDVLFTEGGDRDKLGRGTVWRNEIQGCIHQNHIYRARLQSLDILPEYVSLAAKTEYAKDYFFQNASQTINLASINITTLGNLPLSIPPLEEQKEICSRVYKFFEIAESVKVNQQNLLSYLDSLDRAILAKAFRGELVEQNPTDEPAALLLQRIQAERQTSSKPAKSRKRKATDPQQMDLLS